MKEVEIFTDGACSGNPGPGGYGVVLKFANHVYEISDGFPKTTNNQMELLAVINALNSLKEPCKVNLTTDSEYVKKGTEIWLKSWKTNNWKTKEGKPVQNRELWEMLDEVIQRHECTINWVKGHSGHPDNERCDELARIAASLHRNQEQVDKPRY